MNPRTFLSSIIDAAPSMFFVLDNDMRIIEMNRAAADFLGLAPESAIQQKSGEAMGCIHSLETPGGCGSSDSCHDCVLRGSVGRALAERKTIQSKSKKSLRNNGRDIDIFLKIAASPFEYDNNLYALLILEDITELVQLKNLLPICSYCRKIRDDDNFWQSIENYFKDKHDVDFSHGICEECYKKEYRKIRQMKL